MIASLASVTLTLIGSLFSDLSLLLKLVLVLSTVDNVLGTQLNRVEHPLE